ncbi:HAMP domain-containing sensor histidine kinase [Jeotgalibacillus sp. R-1-5s-1]|uniref:sensor histidine kinase n=1 Tax=Jeotgalibacillus sp. R-1-5s-1 TaxID=2555897 RepID=UPI00106D8330|nr:HAMP domain-containing sensor histidine kinase [Jeotgalibacillus sp. R-1-5s-1]TFD94480.1 HAMP domain-containing histidine kinase [Jeotgalibacillus sp. R-1-5s-1]
MKWTISRKFFIGFSLIFLAAALFAYSVIEKMLEEHVHERITTEMQTLQNTSRQYLLQFAELQGADLGMFNEYSRPIANELSRINSMAVSIYNADGTFLYEAMPLQESLLIDHQEFHVDLSETEHAELLQAFDDKAAYTLTPVNDGTILYFAYPFYVNGDFYGVVRFTSDYTAIYAQNKALLERLTLITGIIFSAILAFLMIFTNQLIKPLHTLTAAAKRIAQRDFQTIPTVRTSDELNELSIQFQHMQQNITHYIQELEIEKQRVLTAEEKRTVFFQHVTHELKTPLTTISGYAQIIGAESFDDQAFLQKAAGRIHLESQRLNEMVSRLLSLSTAETGPRSTEEIDLYSFTQHILEDLELKAGKYGMTFKLSGEPTILSANRDEMKQIMMNVLDNAIKHGTPGHAIDIHVSHEITVSNHAPRLTAEIKSQLFEPFVLRSSKDSHGLGLFITKQLVESNRGTITMEQQDQTVQVKMTFPAGNKLETSA